jgi:predicted lipid-binding transport protein (Tim44 family)
MGCLGKAIAEQLVHKLAAAVRRPVAEHMLAVELVVEHKLVADHASDYRLAVDNELVA